MNLTFLQTFLTVVETGNLNKAAERLNVTQSTVTARLDALEDTLGQPLLVRARRGARLTRAGFELRPYAELLVGGWARARRAINLPKGYSGLFSFACEFDLWHDASKTWLSRIRVAHPELAYEARPGRRSEIEGWLGSGLTAAAMTLEPISGSGLVSTELPEQEIVLAASVPRSKVDWDPTYVFVDLGSDFRRQHSGAFPLAQTAGITFSISSWALEHLLTQGGSAFLPRTLVQPYFDSGRLFLVEGSTVFSRKLYLAWTEASETAFPWLREEI